MTNRYRDSGKVSLFDDGYHVLKIVSYDTLPTSANIDGFAGTGGRNINSHTGLL